MSQQAATIESLPMAFEFVKAMRADGLDWAKATVLLLEIRNILNKIKKADQPAAKHALRGTQP